MTDIALPQGADSPGPQGGGRLATAPLERVRTYWDMVWRTFVRGPAEPHGHNLGRHDCPALDLCAVRCQR